LNEIVQASEFVLPLYRNVSIDLHVEKVDFTQAYVKGSLRTLFVNAKNDNIPLPELPLWPDRMAQVFISEQVFTTFGRSLFDGKILKATLNAEDVPPESPLKLDTKSLETYIPELQAKWPNRNVQVVIEASRPPTFHLNSTGVWLDVSSKFLMNVVLDGGVITKAFLADFGVRGGAALKLVDFNQGKSFNLTGEIGKVEFGFKLIESYMGAVDLTKMERFLNIVIGRGMVPGFNRDLKVGITIPAIPVEGLSIDHIQFEYNQGRYMGVGADVHYKAPPNSKHNVLDSKFAHKIALDLGKRIYANFDGKFVWNREVETQFAKIMTDTFHMEALNEK
jgi:hypothetical protein